MDISDAFTRPVLVPTFGDSAEHRVALEPVPLDIQITIMATHTYLRTITGTLGQILEQAGITVPTLSNPDTAALDPYILANEVENVIGALADTLSEIDPKILDKVTAIMDNPIFKRLIG